MDPVWLIIFSFNPFRPWANQQKAFSGPIKMKNRCHCASGHNNIFQWTSLLMTFIWNKGGAFDF